jgi:hypothetical protein
LFSGIPAHFRRILCGKEFYESHAFKKIKERAFDFVSNVSAAAEKFIITGELSSADMELLDRYGYLTEGKNWFISNLMIFCLFETNRNKQLSDTQPLILDIIIAKGLENFTSNHFIQKQICLELKHLLISILKLSWIHI